MKGLLLDNWTLENIAFNCKNENEAFCKELMALIEVVILWDEIYYFDNGRTYWQTVLKENNYPYISDLIKPISVPDRSIYLANAERKYLENYSEKYTPVVAQGAIEFLGLAKDLKLSYMPFDKRAKFITDNKLGNKNDLYNRNKFFSKIEKDAIEYFTELNEIIGDANLSIKPNMIFNYISNECSSIKDLFNQALELKKHKNVRAFKEWITEFENGLIYGDLTNITKLLSYAKELEKEITHGIKKNKSISPTFSFNIDSSFKPSIGISLDLSNFADNNFQNIPPNLIFPMFIYGKGIGKWQWSVDDEIKAK